MCLDVCLMLGLSTHPFRMKYQIVNYLGKSVRILRLHVRVFVTRIGVPWLLSVEKLHSCVQLCGFSKIA